MTILKKDCRLPYWKSMFFIASKGVDLSLDICLKTFIAEYVPDVGFIISQM